MPSTSVPVETDIVSYLASLKGWEGKPDQPQFQSLVGSAIYHAFRYHKAKELVREVGKGFSVSDFVLAEWARGASLPRFDHRMAIAEIVAKFLARAEEDLQADQARTREIIKRAEAVCK